MDQARSGESGFTLVELMVVVLIIGILVTIAVPMYQDAAISARTKGCLANQSTIQGAVQLYETMHGVPSARTAGELTAGGSSWHAVIVPDFVKTTPACPADGANYRIDADGNVIGDQGAAAAFKDGHTLP